MSRAPLEVSVTVNGSRTRWCLPPSTTLLEALRTHSALTGTKEGCSVGECGACTVLVNGIPTPACLVLAVEVQGGRITTIESERDVRIERMRRAFVAAGALQCGACTPGMIIVASRIRAGADPEEIRNALVGNLCRCTGYASIVRAIQAAHKTTHD